MSKKDYVMVAAALHSVRPSDPNGIMHAMWADTVYAILSAFKQKHDKFDAVRFIGAAYNGG